MENNQQQILSEIKSLMSSVRVQLEQLDAKMAQLQKMYEPDEYEAEPIEMEFDVVPSFGEDDLPFYDEVITPTVEQPEQVDEILTEPSVEIPSVEIPSEVMASEVEPSAPAALVAVIDVMATKHAWRSDMPGTPVKDVRAAIALVDRALFINALFDEDPMAFMDALNHVNQAETLDAAVEYLAQKHPQWDFDSDVVYRFMMAVRRKVNS